MQSVESALETILAVFRPTEAETVPLNEAVGRVLAEDIMARTSHPPRDISAMDGYAVRAADLTGLPCKLPLAGVSPAGGTPPDMTAGEAVRIFTGGAMPPGADAVVIQENTESDGDTVTIRETVEPGTFVRRTGLDFTAGACLLRQGQSLTPRAVALAAAMNHAALPVRRRPAVAVLSTGDEIVPPGANLDDNRIPGSNGPGLIAFIQAQGGIGHDLGIAHDEAGALRDLADRAGDADLLVSTGGVSVGDRDLVKSGLAEAGLETIFWKVAMRPGKPLLFGRLGETPLLAFPGNPVSAMVCAHVFLRPVLDRLSGRPRTEPETIAARLTHDLPANDQRQDYLRTRLKRSGDEWRAEPFSRQDSAMLATLAEADGLLMRPPHAPPLAAGSPVAVLPFEPLY